MLRLLALTLVVAAPASAQFAILPYGGYDLEVESPLVGVALEVGVPIPLPVDIAIRPSAEFVVPKEFVMRDRIFNEEVLQANLDVVASFGVTALRPYIGAGLSYTATELDTADDDAVEGDQDSASSGIGANVLAGVTYGTGLIAPFAQVRASAGDRTAVAVMGGLRIGF
ncbi:hypothetical protein [Rubrivirga sp.]|uniref:hypothetical protein n=1 Tax=Rubrivirga sp. TaxID=1885344 RepID=UPI003C763397